MGDPPSSGDSPHARLHEQEVTPDSLSGPSGGAGRAKTLTVARATAVPSSLLTSSVYLPASDLSENCCWEKENFRRAAFYLLGARQANSLSAFFLTKGSEEN